MEFISTRNHKISVSFAKAMYDGLAPDQGLYVPKRIPLQPMSQFPDFPDTSLSTLGVTVLHKFLDEIPRDQLEVMVERAFNFSIPLKHLDDQLYLLEVFHGPTLSFKDVGARFMAEVLAYFSAAKNQRINIIVATSGDTGSAIADAFHHTPNIDVFILYPSERISTLQEKQITTYGGNIHALEVLGTFDDCQRLVKMALSDTNLKRNRILTTSNSINIARLLPQIIYHAWGILQLKNAGIDVQPILSVPSGNLGNLTSAVYAKRMGFGIDSFIAAINSNKVFKDYLSKHVFEPRPSIQTFANAMDVGNPSNFERLLHLFHHHADEMHEMIQAVSINNASILSEMRRTYDSTGIIIDPHTAVGVSAARHYRDENLPIIITATAHPAKFPEVVQDALQLDIPLPPSLEKVISLPKRSKKMGTDYRELFEIIMSYGN